MSTITDKLPKLPANVTAAIDLDEAKKPLLAAVGVVDLTIEQARTQAKELPVEAKKLQAKVQETVTAKVEAARATRTEQLKAVPAQLKALPAKAQEKATALRGEVEARVSKAQTSATAYYGTLAARGEKLVAQVRKQETTPATLAEGKAAAKKATATAKKTAKPAAEAPVENAG
jgi:NADH-quinone oxidoreductase subunit C